MEVAKKKYIFKKYWISLVAFHYVWNFFNSNSISYYFLDSIIFDSISSEARETEHGKIINCRLFVTDKDV